jgi:phosphoribosylformylglycinamidine synthase
MDPRVCVLRTAGTNCDKETAFAFEEAQGRADIIHINEFISGKKTLADYQILAIPGGFSYGDDIAAGKLLANELKYKLIEQVEKFIKEGKLIIGICNGFQVLVKSGLLPQDEHLRQKATLVINDSGKFEARWCHLRVERSRCVWAQNLPKVIYLPVAHGEGKFMTEKKDLVELRDNLQVVFRYSDKSGSVAGYPACPSGSEDHIAGICDPTGKILGLMPHPERHVTLSQSPSWNNAKKGKDCEGLMIFKNGVNYARKNL